MDHTTLQILKYVTSSLLSLVCDLRNSEQLFSFWPVLTFCRDSTDTLYYLMFGAMMLGALFVYNL